MVLFKCTHERSACSVFVQFLFSFCSICSAFDMHSREIIELAKEKHANGFSYRPVSQKLNLPRSTVQYMINNDYSRVKAKRGFKHVAVGFKKLGIKRCFALLKKRKERVTASKTLRETALKISRRTVHRALSRMRYRYKNAKFTIILTKNRKKIEYASALND